VGNDRESPTPGRLLVNLLDSGGAKDFLRHGATFAAALNGCGTRACGNPAGPAGSRDVREFCGTAGCKWGAAPGRRCTPRPQVYRSRCRRREVAPGPEQGGSKVRCGNGVNRVVPEAFRRTSFWTTLGLVRAEVGPLYLYYGESGEPSTFDPAGSTGITLETGAPAG
jgi:hypothetical protein